MMMFLILLMIIIICIISIKLVVLSKRLLSDKINEVKEKTVTLYIVGDHKKHLKER